MKAKLRRALRGLLERYVEVEIIGQEACPLMMRWEFLDVGFLKAMVHYFPAEVSDRDPHDHPRPFVTLVLRGNYRDESWVPLPFDERQESEVQTGSLGVPAMERLHAGSFRYRSAEHLHIVETDAVGCWTLVVMGPIVREWGFVRLASGSWWPWGKYVQKFGGVIRCDAPADTMNVEVAANVIERNAEGEVTKLHFESASFVPKVGDFVSVPVALVEGKVESIAGGTAWIRDAQTFAVRSYKVWSLRPPADLEKLRDHYYRRGA